MNPGGSGPRAAPDHAQFEHDAGAYLLGALRGPDRAEFEDHLASCPMCTAQVDELAPVVTLLADAAEHDVAEAPPALPDTLLPGLLAQARRRRRRQRWTLTGLAGVAAAAIIALAIVLGGLGGGGSGSSPGGSPSAAAAGRPMITVGSTGALQADAVLAGEPWGTQVTVTCRYATGGTTGAYANPQATYRLQVIDRSGAVHQLGSWTLGPGATARFSSGTALAPHEISAVEITLADGRPVLRLTT